MLQSSQQSPNFVYRYPIYRDDEMFLQNTLPSFRTSAEQRACIRICWILHGFDIFPAWRQCIFPRIASSLFDSGVVDFYLIYFTVGKHLCYMCSRSYLHVASHFSLRCRMDFPSAHFQFAGSLAVVNPQKALMCLVKYYMDRIGAGLIWRDFKLVQTK